MYHILLYDWQEAFFNSIVILRDHHDICGLSLMEWKCGYAMHDCQPRFPKVILTFDKTQALDHLRQDGPLV